MLSSNFLHQGSSTSSSLLTSASSDRKILSNSQQNSVVLNSSTGIVKCGLIEDCDVPTFLFLIHWRKPLYLPLVEKVGIRLLYDCMPFLATNIMQKVLVNVFSFHMEHCVGAI